MTKTHVKQIFGVVATALLATVGTRGILAQGTQTSRAIAGNYVTSDLTVGFVLEEATPNGFVRILIPTATDSAHVTDTSGTWNGGVPQENAFVAPADETEVTIHCPTGITGMTFSTPIKQIATSVFYDPATNREITAAQAATMNGKYVRYLGFVCPYTGTGSYGGQAAYDGDNDSTVVDNNIKIEGLLNPAAPAGNSVTDLINKAVVLPGKIQLLRSSYSSDGIASLSDLVSDFDVMISSVLQEVVVTARVDYQIMFRIDPVAANQTVCDGAVTTDVATTSLLVDYGSPSVNTFVNAAQQIFVDSSANNGYVVTVAQNGNMARQDLLSPNVVECRDSDGLIGPGTINRNCIPNFGWKTAQLPTASAIWTDPTSTGLGYTVAVNDATPQQEKTANNPHASSIFDGGKYARFATRTLSDPVTIASGASTAKGHLYDVCYRLSVDANNNAGVYDNEITYTITATL